MKDQVWVIDDQFAPAYQVRGLLDGEAEVKHFATFQALASALKVVDRTTVPRLLLIDLDLGRSSASGLSAMSLIDERYSFIPFAIFSGLQDHSVSRRLGALAAFRLFRPRGVLDKNCPDQQMLGQLLHLIDGRELTDDLSTLYRGGPRGESPIDDLLGRPIDLQVWIAHDEFGSSGAAALATVVHLSERSVNLWRRKMTDRLAKSDTQTQLLEFKPAPPNSRGKVDLQGPLVAFAQAHRLTFHDPALGEACRRVLWRA